MTGIIVLNYNTPDDCKVCIESIKKYVKSEYIIYLVDNASTEECRKELESFFSNDKLVRLNLLNSNLGYSGGNNVGILMALEDFVDDILIINPDVELHNDIVTIMEKKLQKDVVCVSPKVYDIEFGNGQALRKQFSFKYAIFNKKPFSFFSRFNKFSIFYKYNIETEVTFSGSASGCCFLIDSSFFRSVHLFDDNVFLYCEEYILGKKMEQKCKLWAYCPEAIVQHKEGISTNQVGSPFVDYHLYASEYYLLCRYCNLNQFEKKIIKYIRIINFFIKTLLNHEYKSFFKKLKSKYNEIDKGCCKITFS